MNDRASDLSPDVVAYYRRVLLTHANGSESGVCQICQVARRPDWVDAYDQLAAAGQPMGEPETWEPFIPGWKRARQR